MRFAMAQLNPTVGDIEGNAALASEAIDRAQREGVDLLLFSELFICGYPPKDLLLQEGFVRACEEAVCELAKRTTTCTVVMGAPWRVDGDDARELVHNSMPVLREGRVAERYDKARLPNYDVFDERRYFRPARQPVVIEVAGVRVGLALCEDLWGGADAGVSARYEGQPDPLDALVKAGAQLVVSSSASPFVLGKDPHQRAILASHAKTRGAAIASLNQLGANDELVFSGVGALYLPDADDPSGARLVAAGAPFEEDWIVTDIPAERAGWPSVPIVQDPLLAAHEMSLLFKALTLGVRDYARKCGFTRAIIGASGGIDSALTATIAAHALGAGDTLLVSMPSRYSSEGSKTDAGRLAEALGAQLVTAPISAPHDALETLMHGPFDALGAGGESGLAEENIQSRLRGTVLMTLANKLGAIVLVTGNKSELAVGYTTLYGDMNGALAVLSDILKTQVYTLARWINANCAELGFRTAPIPQASIDKPPSAELRPDQMDQDTLPPYETLDEIVERYVCERQSARRIANETGFDEETVRSALGMIDSSEHKRNQLAVGLKVSPVAFGSGRRMPIAQRWRGCAP